MKLNVLLTLLVLVAGYATCKNLKKTATDPQTDGAAAPETATKEINYPFPVAHVIEGERPDTVQGTYQIIRAPRYVDVPWDKITKPSTSRRAFMATGWWHPIMAFQASDTTIHVNYIGKWLKFKEDQRFDLYINGKVIESGHWGYDDVKKMMYISCKDTYFNNTWDVLERGFRMVWKGNTDLNATGIQVRMDNEPSPPWGVK